jgi:Plasmid pRiA4b ORF-3-like protein
MAVQRFSAISNAEQDDKTVARTSAPKTAASNNILSLKVTLRGLKPPVWRRLLVPGTMTLGELHTAIQAAMGWEDCHLHAFDIAGEQFGDRRTVDDVADENRPTLNSLARSGVARFTYTYDFGDDWEHTIAIEKSVPAVAGQAYPACIAGKRNCPPEDCGGVWGYAELLAAMADPGHPDHADYAEQFGEDFDPDDFHFDYANTVLAARFRKK